MALTLLQRWLLHWDPLLRGLTPRGIANGSHLMRGAAFGRPAGGFNLYRGVTRASIDYTAPVGAASSDATTVTTFQWITQTAGQAYWYALRTIGPGGVECVVNVSDPQICRVTTDGSGNAESPLPAPPRRLQSIPVAGGTFRLRWVYVPAAIAATVFRIYSDGGSGTVSYVTPVATVAVRLVRGGEGDYAWLSSAFADGTSVKWVVRSVGANGEEANVSSVVAVADAAGPTAHAAMSATAGEDE